MVVMLTSQKDINDALEQRVGSTRLFSTDVVTYSKNANEINDIQSDLVNSRLQKRTVTELQKLRQELVKSYSIAKTQIEHSKLSYDNLIQDTRDLKFFLSDESISKRREDLMRNYLTSKKKIEELTRKKLEIREINRIIDTFSGVHELSYTEEELGRIFGDKVEAIKNAAGISKRVSIVKAKKENTEGDKKGITNGESKKGSNDTTPSAPAAERGDEEFETKEIVRYVFKANLGDSVQKLNEIQSQLEKNIKQYEKEIHQIKANYIEDVKKFEAIKKIVGIDNEDEDVEMGDAGKEDHPVKQDREAEEADQVEHDNIEAEESEREEQDEVYR